MSDTIISVENLGKRYTLSHQGQSAGYKRMSEVLSNTVKGWFRRPAVLDGPLTKEDFWALKDVSFEIKQGEVVGIIGRNGAGKSTLLKILSRITEPTTGRITLRGRVASLLEVGTGFHPELTGRENIYLNGAILGMTRAEIRAKFDEIVAFAEIEKFLDTPVKRYSSGMYVRLAFAVAAHLEPEILIVDEVLAVGDAQFQKKCLGKMQDVSSREGRTVLFVSHNMAAVRQLTTRAIALQSSRVALDGRTDAVLDAYLNSQTNTSSGQMDVRALSRFVAGTGDVLFESVGFSDQPAVFTTGSPLRLNIQLKVCRALRNARFSMSVKSPEAEPVCTGFGVADLCSSSPGVTKLEVLVPTDFLAPGRYYATIAVSTPSGSGEVILDALNEVLHFELVAGDNASHEPSPWHSTWGHVRLPRLETRLH